MAAVQPKGPLTQESSWCRLPLGGECENDVQNIVLVTELGKAIENKLAVLNTSLLPYRHTILDENVVRILAKAQSAAVAAQNQSGQQNL